MNLIVLTTAQQYHKNPALLSLHNKNIISL